MTTTVAPRRAPSRHRAILVISAAARYSSSGSLCSSRRRSEHPVCVSARSQRHRERSAPPPCSSITFIRSHRVRPSRAMIRRLSSPHYFSSATSSTMPWHGDAATPRRASAHVYLPLLASHIVCHCGATLVLVTFFFSLDRRIRRIARLPAGLPTLALPSQSPE